jgi:succinoglycan biosynthesis transport protein ExoP
MISGDNGEMLAAQATAHIPRPAEPSAAAGGEPKKLPSRGIHPLRSLVSHAYLATAIAGFIICIAGPPLVYLKGRHYYQSVAVIYVAPRFAKNLEQDQELVFESNSQYREFVQQQVKTINRFDIVFAALQKLGQKRFVWQLPKESDRGAAERLEGELDIKPVPDTYQITVGLEGKKPDGLAEVVNAVVESYIAAFRDEELYGSKQRVESLDSERANLLREIEAKTSRRTQLAQELDVTTFNDANPNAYDQLLLSAKESYSQARRARFDAEAQLASVDGEQRTAGSDALRSMATDMASRDSGLTSLKANLNQRRAELLAKRSGLGEEHPGRRAIDQEITEIDAEIERMNTNLVNAYSRMLTDQKRAEVYKQRKVEAELSREVQEQTRQASRFAAGYQEAMACGKDIERLRKRLDAIDDRIGFLGLENRAPGFIRIFALARRPIAPSKSAHKKTALGIIAAGLLLGILVPIVVDFLDPRIHAANDLQNVLGFALAGWIPEKQKGSESIVRDCRMRLAIALLRENRTNGSSTFLLTGIKPGSGATTLALDLGSEVRRLGVEAVVVEANAFHPDNRLGDSPGLNAALAGQLPMSTIVLNGNRLPPRIPVGDPGPERRLAHIGAIGAFLDSLRASYPIILIDAPPLLLSGDTEYLAGVADVTLLVAEAQVVTKAEVRRAARTLEQLNPRAVGAVLNRVRVWAHGGYYRETIQEYQTATKTTPSVLSSPWLWR